MLRSTTDVAGALLYYVRGDNEARIGEMRITGSIPQATIFDVETVEGRRFRVTVTEEVDSDVRRSSMRPSIIPRRR